MNFDLVTTQTKLKLVKHYLPSAWGLAVLLPSLLVPPSYRDSLVFHISLTVAWFYWIFAIYKIEYAFNKLAPEAAVMPKRTWLMSSIIGSHPTNYLLLASAMLLSAFKQTPLSIILAIAAPIFLTLTFSWYASIFNGLRQYINDRLPEAERVSRLSVWAITTGMGGPALFCFALQMLGQNPTWIQMSFVPIGIVASTITVYWMQEKIAVALVRERPNLLDDCYSIAGCGSE